MKTLGKDLWPCHCCGKELSKDPLIRLVMKDEEQAVHEGTPICLHHHVDNGIYTRLLERTTDVTEDGNKLNYTYGWNVIYDDKKTKKLPSLGDEVKDLLLKHRKGKK